MAKISGYFISGYGVSAPYLPAMQFFIVVGGCTASQNFYLVRGMEGREENIGRALNSIEVGFHDISVGFEPGFEGDEGGRKPVVGGHGGNTNVKGMNEENS